MTKILKYGASDFLSMDAATANFIGAAINTLSLCCTPIELLANDGSGNIISHSTGFYWSHKGKSYLVTNWHVISGRNIFTGELISEHGFIPKNINYFGVSYAISDGTLSFHRSRFSIELSDEMVEAFKHPPKVGEQEIDIAIIQIHPETVFGQNNSASGFAGADIATCYLNEAAAQRIVTRAGDDCFILGYPLQNYEGLCLPIWKRGAISSDTNIGVGGRPIFLVDSATTPAMSGSPVVRKVGGLPRDNTELGAIEEFAAFEVIGIYAGRLQSRELAATNIGYAWYKTLIPILIEGLFPQEPQP